jgi:hypothetical protein
MGRILVESITAIMSNLPKSGSKITQISTPRIPSSENTQYY